jgi:hypothetical protein
MTVFVVEDEVAVVLRSAGWRRDRQGQSQSEDRGFD